MKEETRIFLSTAEETADKIAGLVDTEEVDRDEIAAVFASLNKKNMRTQVLEFLHDLFATLAPTKAIDKLGLLDEIYEQALGIRGTILARYIAHSLSEESLAEDRKQECYKVCRERGKTFIKDVKYFRRKCAPHP